MRQSCEKYIPNTTREEGYIRYFLPTNTGEFCEAYTKVRDMSENCYK